MPQAIGKSEPRLPTIEDVAKRAGVSTATVSRCLNEPQRVKEKTRQRVMTAVRDLGYAPNFGAQALAAKRTNTFGAIIPTMDNAIFARGLQAFQEELGARGNTLLVASSSYRWDVEEEQVRTMIARGADGLLLIGYDRPQRVYDLLNARRIPYVIAWAFDAESTLPTIGFDNERAMAALAEKVLALGHTKVALISAEREENDRARKRADGIFAAMRKRGLDPSALEIVETPYSISNGAKAFETLMAGAEPPTVVMCGNDVFACGAMAMAQKLGLRVPKDVSITGFDDIEIADIVTPALTTVHVPHRKMGRMAAELLVALRNGERPSHVIELDTSIAWRDSLDSPSAKSR